MKNYFSSIDSILLVIVFLMFLSVGCNNKGLDKPNGTDFRDDKPAIQLIYIGSNRCVYCSNDFHNEVKILRSNLEKWAEFHDYQLISTGISVDVNSDEGIRFLQKSGPYDEIVAGWSWYNSGISHHVWNDKKTEGFVPQIKLLKLKIHIAGSPSGNILNIEREEEPLKSLSNIKELKNFNTTFNPLEPNWIDR